jgi:endonuclease YncB( thermonuclease family)
MPDSSRRALYVIVLIGAMMLFWWLALPDPDPEALPETGWEVSKVIDGDTIEVTRGEQHETVRLIGMDTPERDACGYDEATQFMVDIVLDQQVTLVPGATTNRDVHDRLLRYVELAGLDVGLAQIAERNAVARYDSRTDQPHPREDLYREADDATVHRCD